MRRLGEELGVEAMSLYNHVPNKAAILDGVFEIVLSELSVTQRAASWQGNLRDRAHALRSVLRAHPNALPLFATRPAVTAGSIAHLEVVLEILRTNGFSAEDALCATQVLVAFVVGHTLTCYAPRSPDEASRPEYERLSREHFPRVHEAAMLLATHDVESEFDLGLNALLVGLERRLGERSRAKKR